MTRYRPGSIVGLVMAGLLSARTVSTQQQSDDDLRKDIQALKEAVSAIQKDVREIKALLQTRQPAPPVSNVVLELGRNPFKGAPTARVTLVEFSDYQ